MRNQDRGKGDNQTITVLARDSEERFVFVRDKRVFFRFVSRHFLFWRCIMRSFRASVLLTWLAACGLALATFASTSQASTQYFDHASGTVWDTSTLDWSKTAVLLYGSVWTNNNDAQFQGTAGTVTVSTVSANSINFTTDAYTLSSGNITFTGTWWQHYRCVEQDRHDQFHPRRRRRPDQVGRRIPGPWKRQQLYRRQHYQCRPVGHRQQLSPGHGRHKPRRHGQPCGVRRCATITNNIIVSGTGSALDYYNYTSAAHLYLNGNISGSGTTTNYSGQNCQLHLRATTAASTARS